MKFHEYAYSNSPQTIRKKDSLVRTTATFSLSFCLFNAHTCVHI
jgi:hypothetical protein